MIQPLTASADYWGTNFALEESDIEQIYNQLLEMERPQTAEQIAHAIIEHRIAVEAQKLERQLAGRTVYQPKSSYAVGDQLVFPTMEFANGEVTAVREGYNPQYGSFNVIQVDINRKKREFAADFGGEHTLNEGDGALETLQETVSLEDIFAEHGEAILEKLREALDKRPEFVRLGGEWFVKALMAEVNIGHLHLAEAVLEVSGGGPLSTADILPHLDMDKALDESVQRFSLNYALLEDERFDEVAPRNQVSWFLKRLEPEGALKTPERLTYTPIPYDRALLSPQLLTLEQELDDEWSDLEAPKQTSTLIFTLLFPHRWAGTIPLSARIRTLFPAGNSPRQRVIFIDEFSNEEIVGWVVHQDRYIYGLGDWYEKNGIPIGGYVHLTPGPKPGVVTLGYDRRRAQREWVRLATAVDNRIQFELMKRSISCGYDDLLIVGTDVTAAIDALWRRAESNKRNLASLLAELFPPLAELTPQNTVHAKTLYSALNMLRRVPPAPLFAELVRHPAFVPVGDHYWRFDRARWQDSR